MSAGVARRRSNDWDSLISLLKSNDSIFSETIVESRRGSVRPNQQIQVVRGHPLQGEVPADVFAGGQCHGFALPGSRRRVRSSLGKRPATSRAGTKTPVHSVDDLLGRAADVGGDDGKSGGEGFERGVRATGRIGDHHENVADRWKAARSVISPIHSTGSPSEIRRSDSAQASAPVSTPPAMRRTASGQRGRCQAECFDQFIQPLLRTDPRRGAEHDRPGGFERNGLFGQHDSVRNHLHRRAERRGAGCLGGVFHHHAC